MDINTVILCGRLAQAPCTVLVTERGQDDQLFKTFVPCQVYGKAAEKLSELEQGNLVCITGKLSWRKGTDDRAGSLGVFVQTVETERVPLPPAAGSLN